ncbi:hypothetical protein IQ07DRAFT_418342 [Pyrenochaeta sp. DS3sAY3a]|nr:hypothetical protein IQ07DRAFT_418342 [Pyrenochaeta sp. DS3sAY3a]
MLFKTADPWPQSHHDLIEHYYLQYDAKIAAGEFQPFLYPWGTFGALLVIIYLLVPHQNRPWLKRYRYLAFGWIACFAVYTTLYTKARGMAPALGIGLISAWSVVWVGAILVCNDAQTDFMRIERLEGAFGAPISRSKEKEKEEKKGTSNGSVEVQDKTKQNQEEHPNISLVNGHSGPLNRHGEFAWQPYPISPFIERLDWVLDVFCNFRGAGWSWRTSALPPPPKWVQEQLRRNSVGAVPTHSNRQHAGQVARYDSHDELIRTNLRTLLTGYLALDALKTAMMHDPYFWGVFDRSPPDYLPLFVQASPALLHVFRLTLSMLGIKYALQSLFALAPLFFAGVLGPSRLGARAHPWMYPETWAAYSVVLDRGLAGWWSSWWHQTFRFAFEQPSRRLVEGLGLQRRGAAAKALQVGVAFGLSGVLHASGSYTCAGETNPMGGPMLFFALQAVGVFAEPLLLHGVRATGLEKSVRVPGWVKKGATFLYVHVWFYYTAHFLCDDFSRGGVWLFEPVPVSLFRGLGFGADGLRDGWWCWGGQLVRWHRGDRWWRSGIAF